MPGLPSREDRRTTKGNTDVQTTLERPDADPAAGSSAAQLRRRLLGRKRSAREKLWAFLGPAIVTVIGGVLRLWDLGRPHQLVFDETYYVKQGWSVVNNGVEMRKPDSFPKDSVDQFFTNGDWRPVYDTQGDFVVHPPFGKWMIGWGENLFGINNSFGWRFAAAIVGTLSIYLVGRAAWHLFRSAVLATLASLFLAVEGMEFVHSRVSILDIFVMFWALAGFVAILADREQGRRRMAEIVGRAKDNNTFTGALRQGGPWLGIRPWRIVAAVCLGLCMGTKWSGGFFLAAFGVMAVLWDLGARRAVGVRRYVSGTFIKDALPGMFTMVPVAVATYLATWTGWFRSSAGYGRDWAVENPAVKDTGFSPDSSLFSWMPDSLRSLWQYHIEMYNSAAGITSPHDWQSNPWSWMLQTRPVLYFAEYPTKGQEGCTSEKCAKVITSLGTVSLWWTATIGIAVLILAWLLRRDWRAGAIIGGLMAGWLPWFSYQERTVFTFYAVLMAPWVVLIVVYMCGQVLGRADASLTRKRVGIACVGAFTILTVALFIFWWPVYTAQIVPSSFWNLHGWFPSWF
ncbi:dolichyl-phosphate-mannose--protein mannosyltransferase [Dermacoccaceae bacterium W4C1]